MADKAQAAEMLLIQSDDYWGYAGNFEPQFNFFEYTFILSNKDYGGLKDDAEKSRFFPCALFYYKGEADNHGFNPSQIAVKGVNSVVVGTNRLGNREKRKYNVGASYGYSVPGSNLVMLKAPAKKTYEDIKKAVESGNVTTAGAFEVTKLETDPTHIVTAINQTMTQSAESYAAEGGLDHGSAIEPADYAPSDYSPENYTPEVGPAPEMTMANDTEVVAAHFAADSLGNVDHGAEIPANWDPENYNPPSESPLNYEPDEGNFVGADEQHMEVMAAEYNHTVGNFTQDSSGVGRGVPEYYGSGSAGEVNMELDAENFEGPYEPALDDFTPSDPESVPASPDGFETDDTGVDTPQDDFSAEVAAPQALNETANDYVPPVEETTPAGEEVGYLQGYSSGNAIGTITANWDGTPNAFASEDEIAYMNVEAIPNSFGYDSATYMGGRGVPQWYGSAEEVYDAESYTSLEAEYFEAHGEFNAADMQSMIDTLRDMIDELEGEAQGHEYEEMGQVYEDLVGELIELEDQMELAMATLPMSAEFINDAPPITPVRDLETLSNGYGEGTADGSGHGVPQWYGSAEFETYHEAEFEAMNDPDAAYDQGYDDQLDESLGMRHRGPHSQSLKDRRDESKGMEKALGHRPYSSVGTMDAEHTSTGSSTFTKAAFGVGGIIIGGLVAHMLANKGTTDTEDTPSGSTPTDGTETTE